MAEKVLIKDLQVDMGNVDVRFRIIRLGEIKEITTRDGNVVKLSEVEVGDESGRILLSLWEQSIEMLNEGDVAEVQNGFVKVIRDELRLNIGKYGELVKVEDENFIEIDAIPDYFPKPPEGYRPRFRRRSSSFGRRGDNRKRSS